MPTVAAETMKGPVAHCPHDKKGAGPGRGHFRVPQGFLSPLHRVAEAVAPSPEEAGHGVALEIYQPARLDPASGSTANCAN